MADEMTNENPAFDAAVDATLDNEGIQERIARIRALKAQLAKQADPTAKEDEHAWYNPWGWYKQAVRWGYKNFVKPAIDPAERLKTEEDIRTSDGTFMDAVTDDLKAGFTKGVRILTGTENILPEPEYQRSLADLITGKEPGPKGIVETIYHHANQLENSIRRGWGNHVREPAKALGEVGAEIAEKFGTYELLDRDDADEFRQWYKKASNEWELTIPGTAAPILASKEYYDKWAGKRAEGFYGVVEDFAQLGFSLVSANKFLGLASKVPKLGAALQLADKSKFIRGGLNGLIVDAAYFDPYEQQLMKLLDHAPADIAQPIRDYLHVDRLDPQPDDHRLWARTKAAFEGLLIGHAVEGVLFLAKVARYRSWAKAKGLSPEETNKLLQQRLAEDEALRKEFPHLMDDAADGVQKTDGPVSIEKDASGNHQAFVEIPEAEVVEEAVPKEVADLTKRANELAAAGKTEEAQKLLQQADMMNKATPKHPAVQEGDVVDDLDPTMQTFDDAEVDAMVEASSKPKPKAEPAEAPKPPEAALKKSRKKKAPVGPPRANPTEAAADGAAFQLQVQNIEKIGKPFLEEQNVEVWRNAVEHFKKTKDIRSADEILDQAGFNPGYLQAPKHVVNELKSMAAAIPETNLFIRDRATGVLEPGQWSRKTKREAAKLLQDLADEEVMQHAAKVFGDTERLPEFLMGFRMWQLRQANTIHKLSRLAQAYPNNENYYDALVGAMNTLAETSAYITGTTTNVAQALASQGQTVKALAERAAQGSEEAVQAVTKAAKEAPTVGERIAVTNEARKAAAGHRAPGTYPVVAGMSKGEIQQLAHMIATAGDDLPKLMKLINGPKQADLLKHGNKVPPGIKRSWLSYVNTYRAEAMLSGVPTQLGNVVSNALMTVKRPTEYFFSGIQRQDKEHVDEAFDLMKGMFLHFVDSMSAANKAFLSGKETFDGISSFAGEVKGRTYTPISMEAFQGKGFFGGMGAGLHILARMPTRLLMSSDVYFKNLNARAFAYAEEMKRIRQDRALGRAVSAEEEAQRLFDAVQVSFHPDHGAINPKMIRYAQEQTFTDKMGVVGQAAQDLINKSEFIRFNIPFFRTPARIFEQAHQMTPLLNMVNKKMLDDIAAGGERAALAAARADVGAVIFSIGSFLALQGVITGGGPTNTKLAEQWRKNGNEPYTIRFGNGPAISYRRGDPFTTSIGMIADLISMTGEMDENTRLSATAVVISAIARNVTSKTYMQSLQNLLDAIQSENGWERYKMGVARSLVPAIVANANDDPYEREVRDWWEAFKSRWPGWSKTLPPKRNIMGEPVLATPTTMGNKFFNPFTVFTPPSSEDVGQELLEIGKAMPMPAEKWGSVDLKDGYTWQNKDPARKGQPPYDRLLELMAEPTWGDPPLRKRLEEVVSGDEYKEAAGEDLYTAGGARYNLVALEIEAYLAEAREVLFEEYPGLEKAWEAELTGAAVGEWEGRDAARKAMDEVKSPDQQLFYRP